MVKSIRFATILGLGILLYPVDVWPQDGGISPAMFKSHLETIRVNIAERKEAVNEHNDLVANPARPNGQVQIHKEIDAFNRKVCYEPCPEYWAEKSALEKRQNDLQRRLQALKDKEAYARSRVNVQLGIFRAKFFLLGCLAPFTAEARRCAQLAPEAAYACLRELWENHGC